MPLLPPPLVPQVWVFHVMTGENNASAVWAAQRVPDDGLLAAPNTFVIRELDLHDHDNYMASPNVEGLALKMGWWSPKQVPSACQELVTSARGRGRGAADHG